MCRVDKHEGMNSVRMSLCTIIALTGDLKTCHMSGLFNLTTLYFFYLLTAGKERQERGALDRETPGKQREEPSLQGL